MQGDEILFVANRVRRLLEQASQELMRESGLRKVELDILYFLSRKDAGDTARDIIEARNLSKAHISKSVDNLHRTGCITLQADAADRRCVHLHLTPKGSSLAGRYADIARQVGREVMAGVTPEERRTVCTVVAKIRRNLAAAETTQALRPITEDRP